MLTSNTGDERSTSHGAPPAVDGRSEHSGGSLMVEVSTQVVSVTVEDDATFYTQKCDDDAICKTGSVSVVIKVHQSTSFNLPRLARKQMANLEVSTSDMSNMEESMVEGGDGLDGGGKHRKEHGAGG
jgi:hypothetical protein